VSCENARQEHVDAMEAHAAAVRQLKRHEGAMVGAQSPPPILVSDQDVETLNRLEAAVGAAAQLEHEKSEAYANAKRSHQEQ
jgi:hypothetical protein